VEQAKADVQRPSEKSEMKHAERMSAAEKEKFQFVKSINDQELTIQQLETSINNMKHQLAKLRQQNAQLEQPEIDIYAYSIFCY
jgi:septal ring factor EnvC (AmiA/AmiB activator)